MLAGPTTDFTIPQNTLKNYIPPNVTSKSEPLIGSDHICTIRQHSAIRSFTRITRRQVKRWTKGPVSDQRDSYRKGM